MRRAGAPEAWLYRGNGLTDGCLRRFSLIFI
jgi:hypothetical protein